MNPLASMNEGSLFSNANTTSFMGNEIELLKYNFSRGNSNRVPQDYLQYNSLVFFAIKLIIVSFKKDRKKKKKKKWWHARLMRWNLERNK